MSLEKTLSLLNENKPFIYPTETLWGLGCDALSSEAISKIFDLKKRSPAKALSILVRDTHMAHEYALLSKKAVEFMEFFWPGPVSFIVPARDTLPQKLHGDTGFVSLRCSPHSFLRDLFKHHARPIVSTSVNLSGEMFLQTRPEILKVFPDIFVVESDEKEMLQKPSTILKIENDRIIPIREGAVSYSEILK